MQTVDIILPTPFDKQLEILHNRDRYNHIQCGRRFGKTELIKELTTEIVLPDERELGYPIGIFCPIERDFLKIWESLKTLYRRIIKKKDESYHMMELINGSVIHMWSMKAVDNGRGEKYKRVILDEFAKAQYPRQSWEETIRATLTDYGGDAYFLSTPKGTGNYFYILKTEKKHESGWAFFKFTSYDNPYLDAKEIDDAKKTLDSKTFAQEYLAEDIDLNSSPFLYSFSEDHHVKKTYEDESEPIWLSFDFNKDPMTCIAAQDINGNLQVLKEFKLDSGSTPEILDIILATYPGRWFIVTGDATGRNRSALERGNVNHWILIKDRLKLMDVQIKVRKQNISLLNSRIVCNSVMQNTDLVIDHECKSLISQCTFAKVDEYGILIKDREENKNDLLDCLRYLIDAKYPDFLRKLHKHDNGKPVFDNGNPRNNAQAIYRSNGNGSI